jgi:taurine--2-oxoglutarate transaminase
MEGVVGANGVFVPPPGYWRKVRDICDRHGVLLIADEVLSGFGRTGRWFAVDHDGVTPDLLDHGQGADGRLRAGGRRDRQRRGSRGTSTTTSCCAGSPPTRTP